MNPGRIALLAALALSLAACAGSPPFSKNGADRQTALYDYQDCYSKGALEHYTPEVHASVNKSTRACMKARGYTEHEDLIPW